MNKAELIAAVAEKAGLSKKDTEAVINATLNFPRRTLRLLFPLPWTPLPPL